MSASEFGELLARYRAGAGLSQSRLAEIAGLSVETIGALERGARRGPYRTTVDAIAEALRIGEADRRELLAAADRSRARTIAQDAPAGSALSTLPRQSTSCIGREREIAEILGLLRESRMVTITGSAGIGKTRTLFEIAAALPASRRNDVRFVDLAVLQSGEYVLSCIASACGTSEAAHFETIDRLTEFLRPQRLLILLDNCEHLVESVALVVASIRRTCPDVAFLATSRERLAISEETIFRLPPLSLGAALDLMRERISALDADFAPSVDDVATLADICTALDGIPLAIELAAARVPTLGPRAVAARLKGGLALSGGARDLPDRQRTIVATIAWSYSLLNDHERSVLRRLSVFSGFTLESAEAACGAAPDLLLSLVDKSLINAHVVGETVRYAMFEMIRAFARDRLEHAGEVENATQRHAQWCGDLANHVTSTRDTRTPSALRRLLEPELNNVRTALQWCLESARNPVLAGQIIAGLRPLWVYADRNAEGRRWAEAALAQLDERQVPDIAIGLLTAIIRMTPGSLVVPWIERAVALTALTGDRKRLFDLERTLALNQFLLGAIPDADRAVARAMTILEEDGLLKHAPHSALLDLRVWIRVEQGRLAEALSDVLSGESIDIALGESEPLMWWIVRAYLSYQGHDVAAAIREITAVIDRIALSPGGYDEDRLAAYAYLALFQLSAGNFDEARSAAREVLVRTQRRVDYWPSTSIALLAVVAAHRDQGRTAARLLGFVETWHRNQSYLPTIAQRQTIDLLRSALAERIAGDELKALTAEGARMELPAAIENALAI